MKQEDKNLVELLLEAAPIVNSIRKKYGFLDADGPLSWAWRDGKMTFVNFNLLTYVNFGRPSSHVNFPDNIRDLITGSQRDIATKARQVIVEYLKDEVELEKDETGRRLRELDNKIKYTTTSLEFSKEERERLAASPSASQVRLDSIKRHKERL